MRRLSSTALFYKFIKFIRDNRTGPKMSSAKQDTRGWSGDPPKRSQELSPEAHSHLFKAMIVKAPVNVEDTERRRSRLPPITVAASPPGVAAITALDLITVLRMACPQLQSGYHLYMET